MIRVAAVLLVLLLGACTADRGPAARAEAAALAAQAGFRPLPIQAGPFRLLAYVKGHAPVARIYIEGDGHAWRDRYTPSDDPTPWNPVALQLAVVDPAPAIAWLGRPCQYLPPGESLACGMSWWTGGRYNAVVITAMNEALDRLRTALGAERLELVGFSGGGAVAALLAARRRDVASLRTVAANLDTAEWTRLQHLTPLTQSLNPADFAGDLGKLPQLHVIGADDDVVGAAVARAFLASLPDRGCATLLALPALGHGGAWATAWPNLLRLPVICRLSNTSAGQMI